MCLDDSMMPRGFKWEIERGVCVLVLGVNLAYIWRDEREFLFIYSKRLSGQTKTVHL